MFRASAIHLQRKNMHKKYLWIRKILKGNVQEVAIGNKLSIVNILTTYLIILISWLSVYCISYKKCVDELTPFVANSISDLKITHGVDS